MSVFSSTQMDNGWTIVTAAMPHLESLTMGLSVPVGSRHESLHESGAAHFVEHLLFKGTERRSPLRLALDVEGIGGSFNAYTSEDSTQIEMRGPSDMMPHLAEILCDMAFHSSFPADEVDRERQVIEEEIIMYYESPSEHVGDLVSHALWGNHPLGRPILGTPESLKKLDRDALLKFQKTHYSKPGGVIAVAGDLEHESIVDTFSSLQSPPLEDQNPSFEKFDPAKFSGPNLITEDRPIEQFHIALGFHCAGRHDPARYALKLLSLILGENASSRLFQEIRESRGLCYQIGSELVQFDETGALQISAGLDSNRLDEALQAIQQVLVRLVKEGPTEQELKLAKQYLIGQSRVSLETSTANMNWIADSMLFYRDLATPAAIRAEFLAVSREEVHAAAQAAFTKKGLGLVLIGPNAKSWKPDIILE